MRFPAVLLGSRRRRDISLFRPLRILQNREFRGTVGPHSFGLETAHLALEESAGINLKALLKDIAEHLCGLANHNFACVDLTVEGAANENRVGFGFAGDCRLTAERKAAAIDAAIDSAFNRDIAITDEIPGKSGIRTNEGMLYAAPLLVGQVLPSVLSRLFSKLRGLAFSEHDRWTLPYCVAS